MRVTRVVATCRVRVGLRVGLRVQTGAVFLLFKNDNRRDPGSDRALSGFRGTDRGVKTEIVV